MDCGRRFVPEENWPRVGEKVDPFKEADLLNASQKESEINEDNAVNTSNSLISRLSTVKNKAIDVGSKAFSMVSEVANKSFDNKNDEVIKSDVSDNSNNIPSERIEPSFLDTGEDQMLQSSSYENNYDNSGLASDDDSYNIPSFLRRNRD